MAGQAEDEPLPRLPGKDIAVFLCSHLNKSREPLRKIKQVMLEGLLNTSPKLLFPVT